MDKTKFWAVLLLLPLLQYSAIGVSLDSVAIASDMKSLLFTSILYSVPGMCPMSCSFAVRTSRTATSEVLINAANASASIDWNVVVLHCGSITAIAPIRHIRWKVLIGFLIKTIFLV